MKLYSNSLNYNNIIILPSTKFPLLIHTRMINVYSLRPGELRSPEIKQILGTLETNDVYKIL